MTEEEIILEQEIAAAIEEQDLKDAEELYYEMLDDPQAAFYHKVRSKP